MHLKIPTWAGALALDLFMVGVAWLGAFWVRFSLGAVPPGEWARVFTLLPLVVAIHGGTFCFTRPYPGSWPLSSVSDLIRISRSVVVSVLVTFLVLFLLVRLEGIPRSVLPLHAIFLWILLGTPSFGYHLLNLLNSRGLMGGAGSARAPFLGSDMKEEIVVALGPVFMNRIANHARFTDPLRRLWRHRFTQPGLIVIAMAALLLSYWSQSKQFPYYWIHDMDVVQVVDLLAINSGNTPAQMVHTSFGMNLFFSLASRVAYGLGMLPVIDLEALPGFVNPVLPFGQLWIFLRSLSPFVVLMAVAGTWWALRPIYGRNAGALLGALLALGLMPWAAYHATMIRSELYSVLYWAGGTALLFALASDSWAQAVRYLLAGLCMVLSYLTKVQALPLIALSCLLALTWHWYRALEEPRQAYPPLLTPSLRIVIAGALLVLYGGLANTAYDGHWPDASLEGFGPELALLVVGLLASAALAVSSRWIASKPLLHLNDCMLLFLGGGLIAMASHGLLPMSSDTTWKYLLGNFYIAFFRIVPLRHSGARISQAFVFWREFWPLIAVNLALVSALAWLLWKAHSRRAVPVIALLALSLLVAVAGAGLMTRPMLRDTIWSGLAIGFPVLMVGGLLARRVRSGSMRALVLVFAIGSVLIYDAFGRIEFQGKIDANYSNFGWRRDAMFTYWGGANWERFHSFIGVPPSRVVSLNAHEIFLVTRQVEELDRIQRTLEFVLWNVPLEGQRIGLVINRGRVTRGNPELRLGNVTPELEGAMLYDLSQVEPSSRRLPARHEFGETESTRRVSGRGNQGVVALLGRTDLSAWLFLPDGMCNVEAERAFGSPVDRKLEVRGAQGEATPYLGYLVRIYVEIPTECVRASGFLVVREW